MLVIILFSLQTDCSEKHYWVWVEACEGGDTQISPFVSVVHPYFAKLQVVGEGGGCAQKQNYQKNIMVSEWSLTQYTL